jgi:DNA-binding NtrC family response regulator
MKTIIKPTLLIIDDDASLLEACTEFLEDEFQITVATTGEAGLAKWRADTDVALLDLALPGISGLEVLRQVQHRHLPTEVVILTAVDQATSAISSMQLGAYAYITKPFDNERLRMTLWEAVAQRQHRRPRGQDLEAYLATYGLIGQSAALWQVATRIVQVAPTPATVLITGESGVGKALVAHAIHRRSGRRGPFVAVNCAAIPNGFAENELFGHEQGVFTGAERRHLGKFEQAQRGTLLLDEVACLPLPTQGALLRVLQERELTRLGGHQGVRVDVRLLCSTNQDLAALVQAGTFRADLYHRLNVVPLSVPPLRERPEDIPLLLRHFLAKYNAEYGRQVQALTPEAEAMLYQYPWPGNVHELEALVARVVVMRGAGMLGVADIRPELGR